MKASSIVSLTFVAAATAGLGAANSQMAQSQAVTSPPPASEPVQQQAVRSKRSPAGDIGSGSGDIGKGAARGVGAAAKGTGKGALNLVTLHPVDAAVDVGKGGVVAGKDIGVGAVKGTGKILRGTGRGIKKLF